MRYRTRLLIASLCISSLSGCGGGDPEPAISPDRQAELKAEIKKQAEIMQREFESGNLEAFVSYVHPDIVGMAGGKEKMIEFLKPSVKEITQIIEKSSISDVSEVVQDGENLAAFVTVSTIYQFPDGRMIQTSYRVACSTDEGKSWTFLDGQGREDQERIIRSKFPALTERFSFPECSQLPAPE